MLDTSEEYSGSMVGEGETETSESVSTTPTSPASFVARLDDYFASQESEIDAPQKVVEAIEKELGQFWSIKEYDDTERGPIELPREVYPEGSKRNWAGNQVYTPVYEVSPTSKEAAKQVLAKAFKEGHNVTVVGGAYGSSPLVSTRGVIINTHHLCKVLDINTNITASHPKQTITVESGIPIMNVINELYKIGKILPTTPIFAKMAVGGGTAVGVHGTGRNFGTLCDYIEDITMLLINKDGEVEEKTFTKREHPDEMKALSVNLGALGFVYSVTYEVIDTFNLKAVDQRVPWPSDEKELEKYLHDIVLGNEYVELFWWPFTDFLWVKTWNRTDEPEGSYIATKLEIVNQYLQAFCANPFLGLLSYYPQLTPFITGMIEKTTIPLQPESIVAKANIVYNYLIAVPPKHWDLNQCLNIPYVEEKKDYDFSLIAKSYIEVRKKVEEKAKLGQFPLNTTLHARFIGTSDGYLSPINGNSLTAMVEVVTFNMTRDWLQFFKEVEDMWLSFGGRPHWGKLIYKMPNKKVWGGGTGMSSFMKIREQLDPLSVFRTDFHYDVFDRKLPKLMTLNVLKADIKNSLLNRISSLGEWVGSWFTTYEYKIIAESAVDRRELVGKRYRNCVAFGASMINLQFTNFIQFQIVVNGSVFGTAVWHLNIEECLSPATTITKRLMIMPNWFSNDELGTLTVEFASINVSQPPVYEESVAIIGSPYVEETEQFARLSSTAGFKVLIGAPEEFGDSDMHSLLSIPNVKISTPRNVAKCSSFIIFVGLREDLSELVRLAGPLKHKVLVDATTNLGADDIVSVFGRDETVVKIVGDDEGQDGTKTILLAGEDKGSITAVTAWALSIGFDAAKVENFENDTPKTRIHSPTVLLPQNDPNFQQRRSQLALGRNDYSYDYRYYEDCTVPGRYPILKDSLFDPYYLFNVVTRLISRFLLYQVWEKFRPSSDNTTLSGYHPMTPFVKEYFPSSKDVWCPDTSLGTSRLGGPEPRGLRRIGAINDLPSLEEFPFTDAILQHVLNNQQTTILHEIQQGNLFIVNHKILDNLASKPAAPIAVFWWDSVKKQLYPIAIQVFQKFHPEDNPLVHAKDGLLWEAAKIFFQIGTTMVHSSCSHEYDEHVVMGALAMATPRQLSLSHPISILLQPHQHRTVSHAATRNCKMRCNVPTWFFDSDSNTLRSLVTETSRRTKFSSLAFDSNIEERQVESYPPEGHYPYRDDGLLWWDAIKSFVTEYIGLFYSTDTEVVADYELQEWIAELQAPYGGNLRGLLSTGEEFLTTIEELVRIVTTAIFLAGPHHAITHYVQTEYLTAPHHIFPGLARKSWPIREPLTPDVIRNILPSKTTAMHQAQIFDSASLQYDKFGDYSDFPLGSLEIAQQAIRKFQQELLNIENIITEREKSRAIPYPYFLPSRIPNATNI